MTLRAGVRVFMFEPSRSYISDASGGEWILTWLIYIWQLNDVGVIF